MNVQCTMIIIANLFALRIQPIFHVLHFRKSELMCAIQIIVSFCCYCQWYWGFETIFDIPHQLQQETKRDFYQTIVVLFVYLFVGSKRIPPDWNTTKTLIQRNFQSTSLWYICKWNGLISFLEILRGQLKAVSICNLNTLFSIGPILHPQNVFYQFCFKRFNSITSTNHIPGKLDTDHGGKHIYVKSKQMRNELWKINTNFVEKKEIAQ